jgi:hypothetical protein
MLNFLRKLKPEPGARAVAEIDALQAAIFPRISRQEHEAAKDKVARERAKFIEIRFTDGTAVRFCNGLILWADLQAAGGYGVHLDCYDRFGWPKGHPESPATPQ